MDVTAHILTDACNQLGIVFKSALRHGRDEVTKRGDRVLWNGEASRLYVRKAQYHWGWDWGPRMISAGPWKPIQLERYQSRIEGVEFPITLSKDLSTAIVEYSISLENPPEGATVEIEISGPLNTSDTSAVIHQIRLSVSDSHLKETIRLTKPQLWYPIHYGPQPLYSLQITLLHNATQLDSRTYRFGIRRIELIQSPLSNHSGTSFYFAINNIPILCTGSNWIPSDNILTRVSPQRYKDHFSLVTKGNQNMLRVWGGGIYEPKAFYETADELGILVWQDFMFACGQYPAHSSFLDSVKEEAIQQVKRLRWHPSVVLFCGNNEDYLLAEVSKFKWDREERDPGKWLETEFPARYIYEKILPEVCTEYAPLVPYHPGSPWGGRKSSDPTVGDIHQWDGMDFQSKTDIVWHGDQLPYQEYPQIPGRFISEFGMQALPSHRTVNHFITSKSEYYPQSRTMDHHNKAMGFESRLNGYMLSNYRLNTLSMKEYISQSQRMQADALSEAFRGWRRLWRGPGREYVGGILVWQVLSSKILTDCKLNDCWPCTSWSIVDYFLRPKMSWYAIARELRPVTFGISRVSRSDADVEFEVWGVNSTLSAVEVDLKIQFYLISSGEKVWETSRHASLLANQATEVWSVEAYSKSDPNDTVVSVFYTLPSGEMLRSTANWPQPLKYIDFSDRRLTMKVDGEEITISSEKPVKGVILDVQEDDDSNLEWSDNGFDLMPGETVKIVAKGLENRTVKVSWYGDTF